MAQDLKIGQRLTELLALLQVSHCLRDGGLHRTASFMGKHGKRLCHHALYGG